MLEWVVHAGHLGEFDRAVQILGEPELLKMRDVSHIPDDRTHQGIVLPMQIFVRQTGDEQQSSVARLGEKVCDLLLAGARSRGVDSGCCDAGRSHSRGSNLCNDTAVGETCQENGRSYVNIPRRPLRRRLMRSSIPAVIYGTQMSRVKKWID